MHAQSGLVSLTHHLQCNTDYLRQYGMCLLCLVTAWFSSLQVLQSVCLSSRTMRRWRRPSGQEESCVHRVTLLRGRVILGPSGQEESCVHRVTLLRGRVILGLSLLRVVIVSMSSSLNPSPRTVYWNYSISSLDFCEARSAQPMPPRLRAAQIITQHAHAQQLPTTWLKVKKMWRNNICFTFLAIVPIYKHSFCRANWQHSYILFVKLVQYAALCIEAFVLGSKLCCVCWSWDL